MIVSYITKERFLINLDERFVIINRAVDCYHMNAGEAPFVRCLRVFDKDTKFLLYECYNPIDVDISKVNKGTINFVVHKNGIKEDKHYTFLQVETVNKNGGTLEVLIAAKDVVKAKHLLETHFLLKNSFDNSITALISTRPKNTPKIYGKIVVQVKGLEKIDGFANTSLVFYKIFSLTSQCDDYETVKFFCEPDKNSNKCSVIFIANVVQIVEVENYVPNKNPYQWGELEVETDLHILIKQLH